MQGEAMIPCEMVISGTGCNCRSASSGVCKNERLCLATCRVYFGFAFGAWVPVSQISGSQGRNIFFLLFMYSLAAGHEGHSVHLVAVADKSSHLRTSLAFTYAFWFSIVCRGAVGGMRVASGSGMARTLT
jgi:hypothetical protein